MYVGGQENQTIKARNSQQSWFCDRTAYVGGQDFRPKLRFSCSFAATLQHFVPPWKTLGWIQLLVRLWIFAFDTLIAGRWYLMVLVLVLVLVMLYWYRHCYHQCYWYRYDQMSQIATQLNRFRPCAGTLMHLPNHRQTESWQNWNQLYIKIALSPQIVSNSLKKSIIVNTSSPHLITIVVHIGLGHRFDKIVRSKNFTFAFIPLIPFRAIGPLLFRLGLTGLGSIRLKDQLACYIKETEIVIESMFGVIFIGVI